ncbi:MAG: Smr/MutS family protein [Myxococcales bacterium]|nr:Smr/MutS family protein [Myxococcales bacterium]
MLVPPSHLEFLDWPAVVDRLAAGAQSDRGREFCRALLPLENMEEARARGQWARELMDILVREGRMPSLAFPEIEPHLQLAQQGGVLGADEMSRIGAFCEIGATCRRFFARFAPGAGVHEAAGVWGLVAPLGEWGELARLARETFDASGEIRDSASPVLARLRRERDLLAARIREQAEALLLSEAYEPLLQDRFVTQRGDRFVLPVRASFKSMGMGIVHDTSRTGETVFIEPTALVELNNRLKVLELEIRHECRRILEELAALVAEAAPALRTDLARLGQLDFLVALARYGVACDGTLLTLVDGPELDLCDLRHPLLVLRARSEGFAVVANEVHLGGSLGAQLLVVSGPNAGGKTVFLKAVGLAVLSAHAGLPVPASARCRVGRFSAVLADIGDQQSVLGDLSTFSAHLANMAGILETVAATGGQPALVLCDELMAGTNPDQGAALARACLEAMAEGRALGVCTTHYDALKALADGDARFRNAGMEYDPENLRPTFRMREGLPGRSYALDIAGRMGLPVTVLARAQELVGAPSVGLETVLRDLELREASLAAQEAALAEARAEFEHQAEREKSATEALVKRERELAVKIRETIETSVKQAREQLREIVQTARNEAANKGVDRAVAAAREALARTAEAAREGLPEADPKLDLERLKKAWARRGFRGLKGEGVVAAGPVKPPPGKPMAAPAPEDEFAGVLKSRRNSIDVRGLRVDDALATVESRLDEALREGADAVFVIHGYGSGALRKAVREFLSLSPAVARQRPGQREEGGDGVTVAIVRG